MNNTRIEGVKVVDLLIDGGRRWDMEALRSLFSEDEMQYILKMPLSREPSEDGWL